MGISVRQATGADAPAACDAIRRSITTLLASEHENDEDTLGAWLANKTVENVAKWILADDRLCVVAADQGDIVGFGMITRNGEIQLLYVAPEARFKGASKLMLRALEQQALHWGLKAVSASSSRTARSFYLSCGYAPSGESAKGFGNTRGYPVSKPLSR